MALENAIAAGLLQGATLTVQTEVTPAFTLDLSALSSGGPPSPLVRFLRPTISLRREGMELFRVSPAGATDPEAWKVTLLVTLGAVVVLLLLVGLLARSL